MNTDRVADAPLVSVVVIFLDEEGFLAEAIESVLAQDMRDWELLLCDDGSTDASRTIAEDYARRDRRIHVLGHPGGANRGMSATRNLGIAAARGTLLTFLDGDDTWLPQRLRRHVELFEEHPGIDVVIGDTLMWHSWDSARVERDVVSSIGAPGGVYEAPQLATLLYPLGEGTSPCTCDITVRLAAARAVGGFDERFRGLYEDQVFNVRLYLEHRTLVLHETLSRYRQHPDSCMATTDRAGYVRTRRAFLAWVLDDLDRRGLDLPELRRAAHRGRAALAFHRRAFAYGIRRLTGRP